MEKERRCTAESVRAPVHKGKRMLSLKSIFAMGLLCAAATGRLQAQPITKPVEVHPQTASRGEPVFITATFLGSGCSDYQLSWKVEPSPISSILTWYLRLKITATPSGICLPVQTSMQELDTLEGLNPGRYIVRFDTTGDVHYDLRDSVLFTIQNTTHSIATRFGEKQKADVVAMDPDLLGRERKAAPRWDWARPFRFRP